MRRLRLGALGLLAVASVAVAGGVSWNWTAITHFLGVRVETGGSITTDGGVVAASFTYLDGGSVAGSSFTGGAVTDLEVTGGGRLTTDGGFYAGSATVGGPTVISNGGTLALDGGLTSWVASGSMAVGVQQGAKVSWNNGGGASITFDGTYFQVDGGLSLPQGPSNVAILMPPSARIQSSGNAAFAYRFGSGGPVIEGTATFLNGVVFASTQRGVATLDAGTVTVSNALVGASTRIFLTYSTPSGVLGHLSAPAGSITPNTSFVINSDSNLDGSTVDWFLAF